MSSTFGKKILIALFMSVKLAFGVNLAEALTEKAKAG